MYPMNTKNGNKGASDLSRLLIRCRSERALRLEDVATATGLTVMTISLVERDKTHPRRTTRSRIEEFLRKHGYFVRSAA